VWFNAGPLHTTAKINGTISTRQANKTPSPNPSGDQQSEQSEQFDPVPAAAVAVVVVVVVVDGSDMLFFFQNIFKPNRHERLASRKKTVNGGKTRFETERDPFGKPAERTDHRMQTFT
jgi:hypothetical protein